MGWLLCFIVAKIGCQQGKNNTFFASRGCSSSQECHKSPRLLSLPPSGVMAEGEVLIEWCLEAYLTFLGDESS